MNAKIRSTNDINGFAGTSFECAVKDVVDRAWRGTCPMGDCLRGIVEANRGRQVRYVDHAHGHSAHELWIS
jgi:hypothetical protein